ncbi:hypothetical protein BASA81_007877 [Batrachochytrium salamandrivorans]|nr:hypothetical protein BASA81_007877 [Batrachochytrium salamandrivorans]
MDFNGNTDNKAREDDGRGTGAQLLQSRAAAAEWGFKPNRREQQAPVHDFRHEREYNVVPGDRGQPQTFRAGGEPRGQDKGPWRERTRRSSGPSPMCPARSWRRGDSYSPEEIKLAEDGGGRHHGVVHSNWRSSVASCTMQPPARSSAGSRISVGDKRNSRHVPLNSHSQQTLPTEQGAPRRGRKDV